MVVSLKPFFKLFFINILLVLSVLSKAKLDTLWVGAFVGVLLPAIALLVFYLSTYAYLTVPDFLRKMAFQLLLEF